MPLSSGATTSFRRTGNVKPSSSKVRSARIGHRCEFCGKTFYSSSCVTRFCSKQCNMKAYYETHKKKLAARARTKRQALKEPPSSHFPTRDSDLLTVKDFAHRLGICKQTVYTLASKGHVRLIRLSQRLSYISWSEFIDSHRGNTSMYSIPHDIHRGSSPAQRSYRPPGRHFAPNGQSLATPFLRLQIRNTAHRTVDTVRLYFHAGCGSEIRPHNSKHQYETNEISHR